MNSGQIQLIIGPMFCGKSTELIRRIKRYSHAGKTSIVFKYTKDCRYESQENTEIRHVMTHDGISTPAHPCTKLSDVDTLIRGYDIIGIDEGQFMPDIADYVEKWANIGKIIIVAALDGDFRRNSFGNIHQLVPLAEDVIKLKAICHYCKMDAAFSKRTVKSEEIELIGGEEAYVAACRKCHGL